MRKTNYTPEDQWFLDNGYLNSHYDRDSGYVITSMTTKLVAVVETIFRNQGNRIAITPEILIKTIESGKIKRTKRSGYIKLSTEEKLKNKTEKQRLRAINGNKRIK